MYHRLHKGSNLVILSIVVDLLFQRFSSGKHAFAASEYMKNQSNIASTVLPKICIYVVIYEGVTLMPNHYP